ncbi:TROVE domain-containing protein, partial [bacterium]
MREPRSAIRPVPDRSGRPLDGRPMKLATFNPLAPQPKNHAGGDTFVVDPFVRLNRFLMLGSEGGTYYVAPQRLTLKNADNLREAIALDGWRVVREIVEVSESGRAPRQDLAIFALAVAACHGNEAVRAEALAAMPRVCRTATHLFAFLETVNAGRGWGRGLRRAVGDWYGKKDANAVEMQMVKYRRRHDWTHRDALRLSHASPPTPAHGELYGWAVGKGSGPVGGLVEAMAKLADETDGAKAAAIIRESRLPREGVPTALLRDPFVWEALLEEMPMTAMIRNLVTMT